MINLHLLIYLFITFSYNNKIIGTKTKFLILDILDLQTEGWGFKDQENLGKKDNNNSNISNGNAYAYAYSNYNSYANSNSNIKNNSRKNSEISGRRKSSINPKDVEYIKRSRFNSMADELKTSKIEDPTLILNELVKSLGADIEFYQCFKLTEEEFVNKINK
jgi:hypothetical protein